MRPLTREEYRRVAEILAGIADDPRAKEMKQYIQHGKVTTYRHCYRVAMLAFLINRRYHLGADEESLVRGAFLHDFYLYDWHIPHDVSDLKGLDKLHGFSHPRIACENAKEHFGLNEVEENIVSSHMWPLTFRCVPTTREAMIVCLADKMISTGETVHRGHRGRF